MYKQIDQQDLAYFATFLPAERMLRGAAIAEEYAKDELGTVKNYPELVIKALSTEEIAKVMKYCNENKIPVTVRGLSLIHISEIKYRSRSGAAAPASSAAASRSPAGSCSKRRG